MKQRGEEELAPPFVVPDARQRRFGRVWFFTLLLFPLVVLLPLLPVIITLAELDEASASLEFNYLVVVPLLSVLYLLLLAAETVGLSRLLMRGLRPGSFSVYSGPYWRKWLADTLFDVALVGLHPFFATVYMGSFYRWLGARIGRGAEISTASNVTQGRHLPAGILLGVLSRRPIAKPCPRIRTRTGSGRQPSRCRVDRKAMYSVHP